MGVMKKYLYCIIVIDNIISCLTAIKNLTRKKTLMSGLLGDNRSINNFTHEYGSESRPWLEEHKASALNHYVLDIRW